MWVFEEMVEGQKLTEIINTKHVNIKYLPGALANAFLPFHIYPGKNQLFALEGNASGNKETQIPPGIDPLSLVTPLIVAENLSYFPPFRGSRNRI